MDFLNELKSGYETFLNEKGVSSDQFLPLETQFPLFPKCPISPFIHVFTQETKELWCEIKPFFKDENANLNLGYQHMWSSWKLVVC